MGLWGGVLLRKAEPADEDRGSHRDQWKDHRDHLVESILPAAGLEPRKIGTVNYRYRGHQVPSHHTIPESTDCMSFNGYGNSRR